MTISVWRYSHLVLAISSFIFVALAALTGIILSFQPITEKVQPYKADQFNQLHLSEVLPLLKDKYADISELSIDANQFVTINGTDLNGKSGVFYVNPVTGESLGEVGKKNEFFQWTTTLHRSLFLHETGRFFVGLTAFLLFLIATSGTVLIIQRQRSLKKFFAKIVRDNFAQYYHVVLGRLMLIPIILIALTGTFLSLKRFDIIKELKISHKIDFDALRSDPSKKMTDFEVLKKTSLSQVQSIEFPFSDDIEDYYTLKLTDREITLNQVTGDVLTNIAYPTTKLLDNLSMDLHTGRGSSLWAIVLAIASANILFFIYSGFVITWKRIGNRVKNKFKADESEFIILVGSENGSTYRFANAIHQQLIKSGRTSHITELNNYRVFPKAKHFIVFTATYGIGDPPTNAAKFESLLEKFQQPNPIDFSVVGFGSHAYPDFCKFAYEVNNLLALQSWANPLLEIHTVNDKSPDEFTLWANIWSQKTGVPLAISPTLIDNLKTRTQAFDVVDKTISSHEESAFLIRLRPKKKTRFTSGDLLAIYPAGDHRERLYSIGKSDKDIQLSVKLHVGGLGSGYLHALHVGQTINAGIISNDHFHFPAKASRVIMISNGTGIAPFLGMIDQNEKQRDCHLYCGFRSKVSFELYEDLLLKSVEAKKLNKLEVAYSREGEKQYVKDLLLKDGEFVYNSLKDGGTIMICGSLSMQNNIIELLEELCQQHENKSISYYQSHGQILMDCY